MANDTGANVAQFQIPKDLNLDVDVQAIPELSGAASSTTTLTVDQLYARVIPPASGVATYVLPQLHLWKNRDAFFYQTIAAPGGEAKFVKPDGSTDAIGDNLSAANDYAILKNWGGEAVVMVKEVTT